MVMPRKVMLGKLVRLSIRFKQSHHALVWFGLWGNETHCHGAVAEMASLSFDLNHLKLSRFGH